MATILIVEDNISLGELYTRAMNETGASVAFTTTCHDTLNYLQWEPAPDVMLLDMSLPDGNGITILKYLKDNPKFKNTKIIMITGDELYYSYARTLNVQGYFYKPVEVTQLIQRVKQLLGRSSNT